jgi:hypothetical protein
MQFLLDSGPAGAYMRASLERGRPFAAPCG